MDKQNTAMQELIEVHIDGSIKVLKDASAIAILTLIRQDAKRLLELEKQQIIEAYEACEDNFSKDCQLYLNAENFFTQTYTQNEQ